MQTVPVLDWTLLMVAKPHCAFVIHSLRGANQIGAVCEGEAHP